MNIRTLQGRSPNSNGEAHTCLHEDGVRGQLGSPYLSPRESVAVALSGGLDSMAATLLLKERGHRVFALHMVLRPDSASDTNEHIQQLAARLNVPLHIVDLRQAFFQHVIKPFLDAYRHGITPNPCVICNPKIKFTLLKDMSVKFGAKKIATGHYARLFFDETERRFRLFRARDRSKDQSYFLYGLGQTHLSNALFPLGDLSRSDVERFAAAAGMGDCHRPESQEICFISDKDYRSFVEQHLGPDLPQPGPILDVKGRQVGKHQGIHRYTIGQRRGLGIPSAAPYYVIDLEPDTNTVRVGRASDLSSKELLVTSVNWISTSLPAATLQALVQVRSRHREAPAILEPTPEGAVVRFKEPQLAITPGQAAVFYCQDEVLGGGIIDRVIA